MDWFLYDNGLRHEKVKRSNFRGKWFSRILQILRGFAEINSRQIFS